jgi:hypothetical protein
LEVHGEWARPSGRRAVSEPRHQALLGGKLTTRQGLTTIAEVFTHAHRYLFLRQGLARRKSDLGAAILVNLSDRSRIVILDASRRFGNHLALYARAQFPAGKKGQSEYGMIPYSAQVTAGFRVSL